MLRWAFLLLLLLAPLPLGSNRPIPWTVLALAVALMLLGWSVAGTTRSPFERQFAKTMGFAPQAFVDAIRRTEGVEVVRAQLEDRPRLERELERLLLVLGRR